MSFSEALQVLPSEGKELRSFELDRLSLLKAFSQADHLITRIYQPVTNRSPRFALLLMENLVRECGEAGPLKTLGKLKTLEFYSNYWALSFRLKNTAFLSVENPMLPKDIIDELLQPLKETYNELLAFNNDITTLSRDFR